MNEKEKLDQPKLVEVEESPLEISGAPLQFDEAVDSASPIETASVTSSKTRAEPTSIVASYGDLEEVSSIESGRALETIPDEFKEILMVDRLIALLIDNVIVATIATVFFMSLMSIVGITGGDVTSEFLRELQTLMTTNPIGSFCWVWVITFFNCLAPGVALWLFSPLSFGPSATFKISMIFIALAPIVQIAYQTAFIAGRRQASIGKMFAGIKIVSLDGSPPGLGKAFLRECISCIEFLTFQSITIVYLFALDRSNRRILHDALTRTVAVKRKYGLSKHEVSELLPFGLAFMSIAFLFLGSNIYEATYGKIADAKQIETARTLFGENSDGHLRQLWRYTKKRIEAGDYNKSFTTEKDLQEICNLIQLLTIKWSNRDPRLAALTKVFLTDSAVAKYPALHEKALTLAVSQLYNRGDSDNYTPHGDLCLIYLARAKALPDQDSQSLYQKICDIGKSKLTLSENKFKLLAAYLSAMDALGLEYELSEHIRTFGAAGYNIEDCDRLHWSYWDYRLFKLLLAEDYAQQGSKYAAAEMITALTEWENAPGNEARVKTPRVKQNAIEEKTIESLSRTFPRLTVQLKPSYWKYSQ